MQQTCVWSLQGLEYPLEKGMATHSSILAWRTPWTEEPSGLWSIGSHTVKYNWATEDTHLHSILVESLLVGSGQIKRWCSRNWEDRKVQNSHDKHWPVPGFQFFLSFLRHHRMPLRCSLTTGSFRVLRIPTLVPECFTPQEKWEKINPNLCQRTSSPGTQAL